MKWVKARISAECARAGHGPVEQLLFTRSGEPQRVLVYAGQCPALVLRLGSSARARRRGLLVRREEGNSEWQTRSPRCPDEPTPAAMSAESFNRVRQGGLP